MDKKAGHAAVFFVILNKKVDTTGALNGVHQEACRLCRIDESGTRNPFRMTGLLMSTIFLKRDLPRLGVSGL